MPRKITINFVRHGNNAIKFRNKFIKKLDEASIDTNLRSLLQKATSAFISLSNDDCHEVLWQMTYQPEFILKNTFGFAVARTQQACEESMQESTNIFEELIVIPESLILPWRDELRYQKFNVSKDFLNIRDNMPESCIPAYKELLHVADPIIAYAVYNACNKLCMYSSQEDIEHSFSLLSNPKETVFFGGIRSLHFGRSQAIVLKQYVHEIYALLEALWIEESAKRASNDRNTPLAPQLVNWRNSHEEISQVDVREQDNGENPAIEETSVDSVVSCSETKIPKHTNAVEEAENEAKLLSARNIMEEEALFIEFWEAANKIKAAGYDLEKVFEKFPLICKIIELSQIIIE